MVWPWLVSVPLFVACIDEDLSGCGADFRIDYNVRLTTNLHARLGLELGEAGEQAIAARIGQALSPVFAERASDVDLSFYEGGTLAHHEEHVMDASSASYTLYLPVADYRHAAVANAGTEPLVALEGGEAYATLGLRQDEADTLGTHTAGLFAARRTLGVQEAGQQFHVDLYMQNCAAVVVVDHNGHAPEELFGYLDGLACGFAVADSIYDFGRGSVVRASRTDDGGGRTALYAAAFPSRDVAVRDRRTDGDGIWRIHVYVKLDGRYTENILSVKEPLRAGALKIIKARIGDGGQVVTDAPDVGVSVKLDWKPGGDHDVEI